MVCGTHRDIGRKEGKLPLVICCSSRDKIDRLGLEEQ